MYIWSPKHILISVSKHHSHVYLWVASRGSIDPKLRPSETESQCKCGQNTSPASPHTNKSSSAVKRSTFSSAFFIFTKEIRPQRHLLAIWLFPPACPNWACFGGSRKKRPGKKSGDMLVLLVTMGDPSIAGYLRVWQRRYRRGTTLRHRTLTTYQATWR